MDERIDVKYTIGLSTVAAISLAHLTSQPIISRESFARPYSRGCLYDKRPAPKNDLMDEAIQRTSALHSAREF